MDTVTDCGDSCLTLCLPVPNDPVVIQQLLAIIYPAGLIPPSAAAAATHVAPAAAHPPGAAARK